MTDKDTAYLEIKSLFTTPIGCSLLGEKITDEELLFITNQDRTKNQGNYSSRDKEILNNPALTRIRNFIESNITNYFNKVYEPKNAVSLRVTQSWANYTDKEEWHHRHCHHNSFVSGVFYVQTNKETDRIYFFNPRQPQFFIAPNAWNNWNSVSWSHDAQAGDLILFPSALEHMVEPVIGEKTRISIAFNSFLQGELGSVETLSSLIIK